MEITRVVSHNDNQIELEFSDAEAPPTPKSWTTALKDRPIADWAELDDPVALKNMLEGFLRYGFCIRLCTRYPLGQNLQCRKESKCNGCRLYGFGFALAYR